MFDPRFNPASGVVLSGSSRSGKSRFITSIIKDQEAYCKKPFFGIFCAYRSFQPEYQEWGDYAKIVVFYKGFPSEEYLRKTGVFNPAKHWLFICEDLDDDRTVFPLLVKLYTTYCHHQNIFVITTFHHCFSPIKTSVLLLRNANYLVLFSCPRDRRALITLGGQMFPSNSHFVESAYEQAVEKRQYGKLVCDFTVECPAQYRFRETVKVDESLVYYEEAKEENEEKNV